MRNFKYIFVYFLLFLTSKNGLSQQDELSLQPAKKGEHALFVYLSYGAGIYPSNVGAPDYLQPKISRFNTVWNVRVLWHPDHLLNVGLETGRMTFYSYELTDQAGNKGKITLNATPILLEFAMSVKKRISIYAGSGVYLLNTELDYAGKSSSKKVSMGWMAGISYVHPLTENLGLGSEAKWLYASETTFGTMNVQLQLVWKFLKW